ncbi:MAG: crossover junction endodeoxyribonuclease RuvC [Thermoprotei archaeon]|nr:MAG: crossover junction endodeoxyribonuclease RuvC [Thermoprotei archaeon]
MTILGIDPGTATTGYAIIKNFTYRKRKCLKAIDYGCIRTSSNLSDGKRLEIIYKNIVKIIKKHKPHKIAVEKLFFCKNVKTGITVGQAKGVILLAAIKMKIPYFEYTPLQVKQAVTSYGKAEKSQIQKMVKVILNLKKIPKPDDAADALAVAICCAHSSS